MCIMWSEQSHLVVGVRTRVCGVVLGVLVALPAQAGFTPFGGPLLSASGVPPNVVMVFDNSSSMVINRIDGETRLDIARQAAKEVIGNNRHVNFGLFAFRDTEGRGDRRNASGGKLLVEVGDISAQNSAGVDRFNSLNSQLDALRPSTRSSAYTYTPLAETYYEVTRYMRGMRAFYPQSSSAANRAQFGSPIQYRCQKNVGVIITDGLPSYDSEFPTAVSQDPDIDNPALAGAVNLPNWDGDRAGDSTGEPLSTEGSRFYLNDIAQFAYEIDLRNVQRHAIGNDAVGQSWDDAAFPEQNLRTYALGFALDDARLAGVAEAGGGRYYTASNPEQLTGALNDVMREINATAGSGGGAVASAPVLATGSLYYRTQYNPLDWSGAIEALSLDAQGRAGTPVWSSDNTVTVDSAALYQTWRLPQNNRPGVVLALDKSTYTQLTEGQRRLLDEAAGAQAAQALLDWSRGADVSGYRLRARLMGDVINSSLALADAGAALASRNITGYVDYLQSKRANMYSSLLAGANDGFLHVLAADTGEHRLAYLPASAHAALGARAATDFVQNGHVSGVDGGIAVGDAQLNGVWATLAVAGLGAGGRGLVAVRLFDQVSGNAALGAEWEISPGTAGYSELGHSYGKPVFARLNGEWVVIAGNGYGGASGQPTLYVIRVSDGQLLRSLAAGTADAVTGNGLSAPQVVTNYHGEVTAAYAGDLQGRMWKFDLTGERSDWTVAFDGAPLFTAELEAGLNQPISAQPVLVEHPQGGRLVIFGTGKFLEAADLRSTAVQAVYAVWDRPGGEGNITAGTLQPQRIIGESSLGSRRVRTVSQDRVNWSGKRGDGWYLPLIAADRPQGERVTGNLLIRGGRLLFNTGFVQAGGDPCLSQGAGWLMSMDVFSGGMPAVATLDGNDDGVVDSADTPQAGVSIDGGLPGDLVILEQPRILPADGSDESHSPIGAPSAGSPPAPQRCDAVTEFCPCDPAVDECACQPGDPDCRTIYCGQEYNLAATTTSVDLVVGSGNCRLNRVMWRQLM